MRGVVLTAGFLLAVVTLTAAKAFGRPYGKHLRLSHQADLPQGDDRIPGSVERQVYSLMEAMKESLGELSNKRNSWYDRYDVLAQKATNHSAMIAELLVISRVAMPIIWTTVMANQLLSRRKQLEKGEEIFYVPPNAALGEPVPHPLRILPTTLTDKEDFSIEVIVKTNEEANVGIRLMFEPEEGRDLDWDNDDIFFGIDLRWHNDHGNDREISLHDRYDGDFAREVITPASHWPNINVGEKFCVSIAKKKNCFSAIVIMGKDLYVQEQPEEPFVHTFCPKPRRTSKMIADPKKLWLVVHENRQHTGQVEVHNLIWYRNDKA
ncbi:uncharacterized protein LOC135212050 [Macrobrachium nipponense]|uniref:uncharacterized protein LOC135212050 n=1 Tax=Macrobrachium nipponense TaxID=159736 RepID=UPI0030C849DD